MAFSLSKGNMFSAEETWQALLLYTLADTYPAGVPRQTYSTRVQVISAPRLAGDRNPRQANTTKQFSQSEQNLILLIDLHFNSMNENSH